MNKKVYDRLEKLASKFEGKLQKFAEGQSVESILKDITTNVFNEGKNLLLQAIKNSALNINPDKLDARLDVKVVSDKEANAVPTLLAVVGTLDNKSVPEDVALKVQQEFLKLFKEKFENDIKSKLATAVGPSKPVSKTVFRHYKPAGAMSVDQ